MRSILRRHSESRAVNTARRLFTDQDSAFLSFVQRAGDRFPESAELNLLRGTALIEAGQPGASTYLKRAAEIAAEDRWLLIRVATQLLGTKELDSARQIVDRAGRLDSDPVTDAELVHLQGLIAMHDNEHAEAERYLRAAVEADRTDASFLGGWIDFLVLLKRRDEAIRVANENQHFLTRPDLFEYWRRKHSLPNS